MSEQNNNNSNEEVVASSDGGNCNNSNNFVGYDNSVFNFNGLSSNFSNATEDYVIDNFTIFNPYRHNNLGIIR
jgi:hypothetical protein